jgi:hypothetical protein
MAFTLRQVKKKQLTILITMAIAPAYVEITHNTCHTVPAISLSVRVSLGCGGAAYLSGCSQA